MALSKNDSYVLSGSGGKVSLFNMLTFKVMTTFMPSPPAATYLAFHPQDSNIVAVGMEDSTVQIYNVRLDEVKAVLRGHSERITGLAFSSELSVLVSSAADAKMCMWGAKTFEKRGKLVLSAVGDGANPDTGDVSVQFHNDERRLLSIHHSQLAVYDAATNTRLWAWSPRDERAGKLCEEDVEITSATLSCTSNHVYAAFKSGAVAIFDSSSLRPICRLAPAVVDPRGLGVHVVVVAAQPKPTSASQLALGLSNGALLVVEPLSGPAGDWRGTGKK